jgi:hypothetical protein
LSSSPRKHSSHFYWPMRLPQGYAVFAPTCARTMIMGDHFEFVLFSETSDQSSQLAPHRSFSNRFYCRGLSFLVGSSLADRISNGSRFWEYLQLLQAFYELVLLKGGHNGEVGVHIRRRQGRGRCE